MAQGKKLSEEEISDVVNLYHEGTSLIDIGFRFGVNPRTISRILRRSNVPSKQKQITLKANTKQIIDLYQQGISTKIIANRFGCSIPSIRELCRRNGVVLRTRSESKRKYHFNEEFFSEINTEEKAYFLGLIVADGNIYNNTLKLELHNNDEHVLKSLSDTIEHKGLVKRRKTRATSYVTITSNKLVSDLQRYSCVPKKSKIIEYPYYLDISLRKHFIRGYFDGDGSIFQANAGYWSVGFTSSSKEFTLLLCEDFKNLTGDKIGRYETANGVFQICSRKSDTIMKAYVIMYENANIYLTRKKETYDNFINHYFNRYQEKSAKNKNSSSLVLNADRS